MVMFGPLETRQQWLKQISLHAETRKGPSRHPDIDMHEIRAVAVVAAPRAQRATGRRIANKTRPRAVSVSVLFPRREIKRKTPVHLDYSASHIIFKRDLILYIIRVSITSDELR